MKRIELYALPKDQGQRIDLFVCEQVPELTRNSVQRLCGEASVLTDGIPVGKSYRLSGKETVVVLLPDPKPLDLVAQDIPLDILYEDGALLIINKPRGMVVHPAPGNEDGTLVNALLYHCGPDFLGIGGVERPGIVHRIDKLTSGLLVVAKTAAAHEGLSRQIAAHSIKRGYEAVVHGILKENEGTISAPIGRHPIDRKKMAVQKDGRHAVTHFRVLARYRGFTHAALTLETGRTHQIRIHMMHIGHPVAGDEVYGPKKGVPLGGQCLHAKTLAFVHPTTGEFMQFASELPNYFMDFLLKLSMQQQ